MRTSFTPSQGRGLLWGAREQGVPHRRPSIGNDPVKTKKRQPEAARLLNGTGRPSGESPLCPTQRVGHGRGGLRSARPRESAAGAG
jgi:hypothetical protein